MSRPRGRAPGGFDVGLVPWVTLTLAVTAILAGAIPGASEALQYDRARVGAGELWRPLTGQLVHWTPRMALADLGAVFLLGAWIEAGGRRRLAVAVAIAVGTVGLGVHALAPWVHTYRGASGLAMALATLAALDAATLAGPRALRAVGYALLAAVVAKVVWEWAAGTSIAAGTLPAGVAVLPLAHALGVGAGVAAGRVGRGERWGSRRAVAARRISERTPA